MTLSMQNGIPGHQRNYINSLVQKKYKLNASLQVAY